MDTPLYRNCPPGGSGRPGADLGGIVYPAPLPHGGRHLVCRPDPHDQGVPRGYFLQYMSGSNQSTGCR